MNPLAQHVRERLTHQLAELIQRVDPTPDEWGQIEAALPRYGVLGEKPCFVDLLDDVRPGILSIASIMAQGVEPGSAEEAA